MLIDTKSPQFIVKIELVMCYMLNPVNCDDGEFVKFLFNLMFIPKLMIRNKRQ